MRKSWQFQKVDLDHQDLSQFIKILALEVSIFQNHDRDRKKRLSQLLRKILTLSKPCIDMSRNLHLNWSQLSRPPKLKNKAKKISDKPDPWFWGALRRVPATVWAARRCTSWGRGSSRVLRSSSTNSAERLKIDIN